MEPRSVEYERLPGRGRPYGLLGLFTGPQRLWLGADHLLAVQSQGYTESYRRFYYRDIQAIVLRRTSRSATLLGLLLLVLGFTALGWFMAGVDGTLYCLPASLPLLVLFLIHAARGPTCRAYIQTAVSREQLPALRRVRTAHTALARLTPRIVAVQGVLGENDLLVAPAGPTRAPLAARRRSNRPSGADGRPYRGGYHLAAFAILLADAAMSLLQIEWSGVLSNVTSGLVSLVLLAFLFAAASRPPSGVVTRDLRRLVWMTVAYLVVGVYAVGYIAAFNAIKAGESGAELMFGGGLPEGPTRTAILVVTALLSTMLGTAGLMATLRARRAAVPPKSPPPPGIA